MRELDTKWTEGQRACIRARGETLLVSAAAGSGKTAVLTERIIDRLLDGDEPLDLLSILVVTFTRAAAAELRSRIRGALSAELAKNPDNRRLHTQLLSVGQAKICTIDAFCLDLIRTHFAELGLSAGVSVMDEAQAKLLAKTVMDDLIDDCYAGAFDSPLLNPAAFGEFADHLVSSRMTDALAEKLLSVRDTVNGFEEGLPWINDRAEELRRMAEDGFLSGDSVPETLLRKMLSDWAEESGAAYENALSVIEGDAVYDKNYGDGFRYERTWCAELSAAVSRRAGYGELRERFHTFSAPALKSGIRGDKKTEEIIRCKAVHDGFIKKLKDIRERFFSHEPENLPALNAGQAALLDTLYAFLSEYEKRLSEEKARRKTLDFGDMGRLALRLLWDAERGEPTVLAVQERAKFEEIYIDEYQDVSPVQDRIFSALARGDNRFMVGDAKQSIYAFRGASPELFLGYRAAFDADPDAGRTIFLSNNFRCDEHIIDFSNLVFSVLFGVGGGLPYHAEDALVCSKRPEGEDTQTQVSVAFLQTDRDEEDETAEDGADTAEGSDTETAGESAGESAGTDVYTEAEYIADTVSALLKNGKLRNGERLRPRDIAVLLRSAKTSAPAIAQALRRRAVPSFNNTAEAFFENAEVLLMYSLLSVIDNPQKDVFLAGTLKSPLFRVTLDELIHIRRTCPEGSLYDALVSFTEQTGFAKGKFFLDRLQYYRHLANGMPVDRFLWAVYQDTGILALVYEKEARPELGEDADPAQMRANLMMFYEYARSFEAGGFQGLYQFVLFIGDVIEEKAKLPPVQLSGEDADAVHIMTIHQSKGLEFPVCFVPGLGKKFNEADLREPVVLDRAAGMATYLRDETGLAKINHPVRECIRMALSEKQTEEEMRILYVALTRAREQLYLSAAVREPRELLEKARADTPSASSLHAAHSFAEWLAAVIGQYPDADCYALSFPTGGVPAESIPAKNLTAENAPQGAGTDGVKPLPEEIAQTSAPKSKISYAAAKKRIAERFSFVYPWENETRLPAKTAVSDLLREQRTKPARETEEESAETREYTVPRFLAGELPSATAAQRGTATHVFMQFCDYRALSRDTVDEEIERLVREGFLSRGTADEIDRAALRRFTMSDLFRRLGSASSLRRELRFNLHLPASVLHPEDGGDAKIFVQGIIDCLFTDADGKTVLLDYKTDHFGREQFRTPGAVEEILSERYAGQLAYYRYAAEQLLCRPVDEVRIYSFALGCDFCVKNTMIL